MTSDHKSVQSRTFCPQLQHRVPVIWHVTGMSQSREPWKYLSKPQQKQRESPPQGIRGTGIHICMEGLGVHLRIHVHLGFCSRLPWTEWFTKNTDLFLFSLEAESPQLEDLVDTK